MIMFCFDMFDLIFIWGYTCDELGIDPEILECLIW